MIGVVKAISEKTKGILLENENDWLDASEIWDYAKNVKKGDTISYSKFENSVTFVRKVKPDGQGKTAKMTFPQKTYKPLDTETIDRIESIESCVTANYKKLEAVENMLGTIIENLADIKKQLGDDNGISM